MTDEKLRQGLELKLNERKGIDVDMLKSLKNEMLYIHEGDNNMPYVGVLKDFGESFIKFSPVSIFNSHYDLRNIDRMAREYVENKDSLTEIQALYKNRNDIVTLCEFPVIEAIDKSQRVFYSQKDK